MRYDYRCAVGHVTEQVAFIDARERPCPICGLTAQREPFYADQYIQGETVAKPSRRRERHPALDKHGRIVMDRVQEAQDDVLREARRTGREAPDFLSIAKERVRRGQVERALAEG